MLGEELYLRYLPVPIDGDQQEDSLSPGSEISGMRKDGSSNLEHANFVFPRCSPRGRWPSYLARFQMDGRGDGAKGRRGRGQAWYDIPPTSGNLVKLGIVICIASICASDFRSP